MKSFVITVFSGMFLLISGQALAGEVDRVRFDSQQVDTGGKCVRMRLELFYY